MRVMKWSMIALAVSAGTTQFAMASSQDDAKGFVEDSTLTSKTRMLYMNRDFRNGASNPTNGGKSGYREDWGLSELLNYQSGFTQGTIGVGVDAFAMGTARLDGGAGRQGNGLLAGAPATFTGNDLKTVASDRTHHDRLHHALGLDRVRQFFERLRVHVATRLIFAALDQIQGQMLQFALIDLDGLLFQRADRRTTQECIQSTS